MSNAVLKPTLSPVVGYREVANCLGVSRRTIERMVREHTFPKPIRLSKNRVGWPADAVQSWLDERGRGLASVAVSSPDDLEPDVLEDHARELAAKALSRRTGQLINPTAVSLHLGQSVSADEFVALEMAEHRIRAEGLASLDQNDAAVVAAVLLPSLRCGLVSAYPELALVLRNSDELEVQFKTVSDVLRLFELSARLCKRGARVPAGETAIEHVAGFETGRAVLVAAQLFPALREMIIAEADGGPDFAIFADDGLFQQAVTAALDDTAWPEFQAKLAARQTAGKHTSAAESTYHG
jgi:predicted DNA-binding transcriptional regulator AlpA